MNRRNLLAALALSTVALATACAGTAAIPGRDASVPHQPPIARPQPQPVVDVARLRSAIVARRSAQIDRLRAYRVAGVFPRNTYSDEVVRVLIDERGILCAVANLIALDGHRDLVDTTAAANRFIVFDDVTDGPLHDWVLTSGLTKEEIVAIQLPDSPVMDREDWSDLETARLTQHLLDMERQLLANFDTSVAIAVERAAARSDRAIALYAPAPRTLAAATASAAR